MREDSTVDVSLRNGKIVLVPVVEPAPSLDELLKQITPRNRHHEIEIGGPLGGEIW